MIDEPIPGAGGPGNKTFEKIEQADELKSPKTIHGERTVKAVHDILGKLVKGGNVTAKAPTSISQTK